MKKTREMIDHETAPFAHANLIVRIESLETEVRNLVEVLLDSVSRLKHLQGESEGRMREKIAAIANNILAERKL